MPARVGLVTAAYGDPWNEEQFITRRIAAAIACVVDVDVLVADGIQASEGRDGAVRVLHFPTQPVDPQRRRAVVRAATGLRDVRESCACLRQAATEFASSFPRVLQDELARADGGDSSELFSLLRRGSYDTVVFCGLRSAATALGIGHVPESTRVVCVPLLAEDPAVWLSAHRTALARANLILVLSASEEWRIRRLLAGAALRAVSCIDVPLRVNGDAASAEPQSLDDGRYVVTVRSDGIDTAGLVRQAERLAKRVEGLTLWVLDPRAPTLALPSPIFVRPVVSRTDVWRWMIRAVAVLDPGPPRPFARDTLEAMLCGVPVIVRDQPGAAREHAERGNGGLWYRTDRELVACLERLSADNCLRQRLGEQGREYAVRQSGHVAAFIEQARQAVLG